MYCVVSPKLFETWTGRKKTNQETALRSINMAKLEVVFKILVITIVTELWHSQGDSVQGQLVSSTTKSKGFTSLDLAAGLSKYIQHETKRLEIIKT